MRLPDMHRITGQQADWERIPSEEWNVHQQRAAATFGIDTPGNRETLKGVIGSIAGIQLIDHDRYFAGAVSLFYGRRKDMKDGKIADETGTKSPIGEALDAIGDSSLMAVALPVFKRKELISEPEADTIKGIILAKVVGSGIAKIRKREEHASRAAKIGMFGIWSGFGLRLTARVFENAGLGIVAKPTKHLSDVSLGAGLALSATASTGYVWTAIRPLN